MPLDRLESPRAPSRARPLTIVAAFLVSGCVLLPPGTSTGDLAATRGGPSIVLSDPAPVETERQGAGRSNGVPYRAGGGWGGATRAADLTHVALDLAFDVEAGRVVGEARSTFRAMRPNTQLVVLDAVDLEIREVLDADGRPLAWRTRDNRLEVTLDAPLQIDDEAAVAVRFQATPVRGLRFSIDDGDGYSPELFGTSYERGLRHWLPIAGAPGDLTRVETRLRLADGMSGIANGVLVGIEDDPAAVRGERIHSWNQAIEIPVSAIAVAAGRFEAFAAPGAATELYFHVPSGTDEDVAQRTFGEAAAVLDYFTRRLDASFPFPRYDQALVRDPDERTLDGATLTLMATSELSSVRDELDDRRERPRRLVARGIARKWFGAFIAPFDETHRWLLDGLATQLELDYEARVRGPREVALEWEEIRLRHLRLAREELLGDVELTRNERAERAAWVLHMLRTRLGEASYWRLVQAFASGARGRVVTVEDFRRLALDLIGVDVGPQIAQWAGRRSLPELEVRFQRRSVPGVGESLGIVVDQTQPGPPFRLALPVVVHFEDGTQLARTMAIEGTSTLMILPIEKRVIDVSVDPAGAVLADFAVTKEDDSWLAQAALSRSAVERFRAIAWLGEAAETNADAQRLLIANLLQSAEPSLREAFTRAMTFQGPTCDLALQRAAADDASPIVRQAAIHQLIQRIARGRWEPGPDETERLLALRQREVSPAVIEELEELLSIVP